MLLIKKHVKIILSLFLMIVIVISTTIYATTTPEGITEKITLGGSEAKQFEGVGNKILGIVRVIGIIASVGTLMVLGIKYMIGSVEEKAEYKKSFRAYIIGAILVFCITTIGDVAYKFINEILP